jgi:hypothetical protein
MNRCLIGMTREDEGDEEKDEEKERERKRRA